METKKCSKCGEVLTVDNFYKKKDKKDGFTCHCKRCIKNYLSKNSNKIREREKYYRHNNKDIIREREKIYDLNHKNQRSEKHRKYYAAYKDLILKRCKEKREIKRLERPFIKRLSEEEKKQRRAKQAKLKYGNDLQYKNKRLEYGRIKVTVMPDSYISNLLRSSAKIDTSIDIPQSLIEIKRLTIKIKRQIKNNQENDSLSSSQKCESAN